MKSQFFKLILGAGLIFLGINISAQVQINPQIGLNFTSLTKLPQDVESTGEAGMILGADFRFGNRFFIMPGVFYLGTRTSFTYDSAGTVIQKGEINAPGLKLRAMGGWRIINGDNFGLRLAAGPSYTAFFNIEKTSDGSIIIRQDDFNNGTFGGEISLGFDVFFLTLEMGYVYGFSDAIKTNTGNGLNNAPKYQSIYITAGINLGKGKK